MRIGVFVIAAGRRGGGPETYEIQLLRALARIDQENDYFIYCTSDKAPPAIGVEQHNFHYRVLWPANRWISVPIALPICMMRDRLDFYHATMVPPPWSPKPFLLTILCSSNWFHPEFYSRRVVWRLNKLLERSLYRSRILLCISQDLQNDVNKMWGIPDSRMRVTHLGAGEEFFPREIEAARRLLTEKYGVQGRYLLFIGQQQERKNVFRVIEAYARFRARAAQDSHRELPRLLLIGRENDPSDAIAKEILKHGVQEHVTRCRYVSFFDLPELYSAADALVFPSLWEGFGLPVIEAMACGTPVITSTVTCLPEVAGDAAILVDPESVDAIAEAISTLHFNLAFRDELIRKGKQRAGLFTWENCANVTLQAYRAMLTSLPFSKPAQFSIRQD